MQCMTCCFNTGKSAFRRLCTVSHFLNAVLLRQPVQAAFYCISKKRLIQVQQMHCPYRYAENDARMYGCRTAVQAFIIDTIHTLVEEKISPVLVRLATTGPQVSTILSSICCCLSQDESTVGRDCGKKCA